MVKILTKEDFAQWKELSRDITDKLTSAGTSLDQSNNIENHHFRAWRFIQKNGYTPDDILGYVILEQTEVKTIAETIEDPIQRELIKKCTAVAYYLKPGREQN